MMKKDKNGQVVEFEDEAVTRAPDFSRAQRLSTAPVSQDDIETDYQAAVKSAAEESMRSQGAALKALQDDVIRVDEEAKLARQFAKDKFANARRAAERQMKLAIEAAEVVRDAEIAEGRKAFYKAMDPINARVKEIEAEHQVKLDAKLAEIATFRQQQLAMLVKPAVEKKAEPAETVAP
jgi:hypothetical protein